ncbi:hypothetical protein [Rheinheimera sp.]|uniref:hypothetical protein n=1 Tax=Rheinheimera sp. TaxID=1869214 RepID=UPI00307E3D40
MKPERGVALIQVLFICTILALLALHFTLTGRQQVQVASLMQDRTAAQLKLNHWQNEILFALLTQPSGELGAALVEANPLTSVWNFYGKSFTPEPGVTIKLQDLEGLVALTATDPALLRLLDYLQLTPVQRSHLLSFIEQQQGGSAQIYRQSAQPGRSMFLQSLSELEQVRELSPQQLKSLQEMVTAFPKSSFNPLHAPDEVLKATLPAEVADEAIRLRDAGSLTADRYLNLVKVEDSETVSFIRGERIRLEIRVEHGGAVAKRRLICYIRPGDLEPLLWLE